MMEKALKFGLPPLLIIIALFLVIQAAKNRPQPEEREVAPTAMLVDTISPEAGVANFVVQAQGTVQPRTQTQVAAEVGGRIVAVSDDFVAGGFFRAGDVLAEIDPSDYEAALLQAEADLSSARARLSDEQARSDQARQDWQRLHGSEREPGELVLRLPQVAGAQAAVQAAEAAVLRARRNLERTRIRLPYDGMVRSRQVNLGQFVSPGSILAVTFAVDVAEVRLPLSDQDMAFLDVPRPGRNDRPPMSVRLSGTVTGQRGEWQGWLVRTEGVVEESSRLNFIVVQVEDPYGLLEGERRLPLIMGTFVQAEVQGRSAEGLMVLPRSALREGDSVYRVDADSRLDIRRVQVMRATPDRVYIYNDLAADDQIVTTAISAPIPGMNLRVRQVEPTEPALRVLPADETINRVDEQP